MDFFVQALQKNPELAIFLTLAIGFLIGRIKFGSFSLGIVVGTLLAGVLIGQLDIKIPPIVKTIFFDLFLFTTGYKVGPQFFRGLKGDAIPQVALTVILCVACLLTSFGFSKLLGYDVGTAAGLLAGAFSESTVIGTAGEAIQRLAIPDAEKSALLNNIPVAYAVTYLVGTASLVWFLPTIGPKLMRINLREEGERMRAKIGAAELELGVISGSRFFDIRAYRVTNPDLVNKTVAELEALPQNVRVFIARIRHRGEIVEAGPTSIIHQDDVVAILARQEAHVEGGRRIGPEVDDKALLDVPIEALDVVITQRAIVGKTIAELARLEFDPWSVPAEAHAGRARDAHCRQYPNRSGRRVATDRNQAGSRAGGEGTGISRPPDHGDRHGLCRDRHRAWRVRRPALGHRRRNSADTHRQRWRPRHGAGVRLASLGISLFRSNPRAGNLDLRYRRVVYLHRRGWHYRRPQFLCRPSENRT